MSISAVSVGRVSENLKILRLLDTLRQNTVKLFEEENRLATGYKLLRPSENPIEAASAIKLDQLLEGQDQILTNLGLAGGFLDATDASLMDINTLLIEAQDIASEHSGNLSDQNSRDAAAIVVNGIIDQLVMIGNRTHQGRYLFAGQRIDETPFVRDSGYVQFVGDTGDLTTHVDASQEEAYNLTGDRLFGALSSEVAGWVDLNPTLANDTRLCDCGGTTGRGITPGMIEITETAVATFTVDLSQADTVGDVVDLINQAAADAGSSVTANINPGGDGIELTTAGPTIEVADTGQGTTARDLGILTSGAVATVPGGDIQARVTLLTRLGDLGGVNLADLAAGFTIDNGSRSATIDTGSLAGSDTVQDLLNLINSADVYVLARVNENGTGIDVVNQLSGPRMTLSENGGTTAEALGVRSMHGGTLLADLNDGHGVSGNPGESDLRIVARDGTSFDVDINDANGGLDYNNDGVETLDDVIDAINDAATLAGVAVSAGMATTGNGIRLLDTTGVNGTLSVERMNLSYAVDDLGLTGLTASGAGPSVEVVGQDVNGIAPEGALTALQQLHDALVAGDTQLIQDAAAKIEEAMTLVTRNMGEVGARAKAMSDRLVRTEDAVDATRAALSKIRDLDYTESVTRFQQAQLALEANLTVGAKSLNLSLLDFIG